ncbi:MAG: lamin tail domain-containing protein [Minisyncoccia bacterium]
MPHNLILLLVSVLFLTVPSAALAQVVITEIMFDLAEGSDSGREWIEVYNFGAALNLTELIVLETGKKHKISSSEGEAVLAPNTYAVIADNPEKFKIDHPAYVGQIFDSAFNLNNAGETIALQSAAGVEIDSVIYTKALGGNGTGDSLQRVDTASFSPGIETPGTGVPAEGLTMTPVKVKVKKASAKKAAPAPVLETEIVRDEKLAGSVEKESQVASISIVEESTPSYLWYLGVFAIAGFGAGGVALARHARKSEWDIIEETDETS